MRDTSNRNRAAAQELSDLAQAEGLQLVVIELDVRDSQRHGQVIEMMVNKSGRVDALINNAGIIVCTPADCVTPRILETQFNTNVYGPSMLSSKVLEVMTRQGQGQLITVSSTVGRLNFPGISLYCASKHALESNFETLAKESTDARIQFSLIQPGPYRTRINPNAVNILESVTIPELRRERPMLYQQRKRDLESLAERFRGIPPHDPQEVADQILRCLDGTTHKPEDGLRFPVGHGAEFPVLQEINRVHHWGQKILS
jgi:NAD(P)-dependent dehydrogenase (short-subunit alcohol dehydrogenase family)